MPKGKAKFLGMDRLKWIQGTLRSAETTPNLTIRKVAAISAGRQSSELERPRAKDPQPPPANVLLQRSQTDPLRSPVIQGQQANITVQHHFQTRLQPQGIQKNQHVNRKNFKCLAERICGLCLNEATDAPKLSVARFSSSPDSLNALSLGQRSSKASRRCLAALDR